MKRVCLTLAAAAVFFAPGAAIAQSDQVNTRTEYPADWYFTPAEFPCLVETIHVTGAFEERLHVVFNPAGGYTYQVHQTTKGMMAEGLTSGIAYRFNGPLSYTENGSTDEPWVTWYPVEFTFHNINHFEGPGQIQNIYFRTLVHMTFDRVTGETKVEISRDDVLCK